LDKVAHSHRTIARIWLLGLGGRQYSLGRRSVLALAISIARAFHGISARRFDIDAHFQEAPF